LSVDALNNIPSNPANFSPPTRAASLFYVAHCKAEVAIPYIMFIVEF